MLVFVKVPKIPFAVMLLADKLVDVVILFCLLFNNPVNELDIS